jgi:hypothetical protein
MCAINGRGRGHCIVMGNGRSNQTGDRFESLVDIVRRPFDVVPSTGRF